MPMLATHLGVQANDVFYGWMRRKFPKIHETADFPHIQYGPLGATGWTRFFHGTECDLTNTDGRFLRIEFGPGGRTDIVSSYAVQQFVMASREPWASFERVKAFIQDDHAKAMELWNAIDSAGFLEPAPALNLDGELSQEERAWRNEIDRSVNYRKMLSPLAWSTLDSL